MAFLRRLGRLLLPIPFSTYTTILPAHTPPPSPPPFPLGHRGSTWSPPIFRIGTFSIAVVSRDSPPTTPHITLFTHSRCHL